MIPYIEKAKQLLEWNRDKLTSFSNLTKEDVGDLFAPEFVVMANGREYKANHQNYLEFLNQFRSDIAKIDYKVQEYITMGSTVVMPLAAKITNLKGENTLFHAIMLIKFNDAGKIVHWQEVYVEA